jgi:hypothetical protein
MLKRQNQRWVPILDPCIHIHPGYAAYDSGIKNDVFVKDISGRPYVGQARRAPGSHESPDSALWPDPAGQTVGFQARLSVSSPWSTSRA